MAFDLGNSPAGNIGRPRNPRLDGSEKASSFRNDSPRSQRPSSQTRPSACNDRTPCPPHRSWLRNRKTRLPGQSSLQPVLQWSRDPHSRTCFPRRLLPCCVRRRICQPRPVPGVQEHPTRRAARAAFRVPGSRSRARRCEPRASCRPRNRSWTTHGKMLWHRCLAYERSPRKCPQVFPGGGGGGAILTIGLMSGEQLVHAKQAIPAIVAMFRSCMLLRMSECQIKSSRKISGKRSRIFRFRAPDLQFSPELLRGQAYG